LFFKPPQLCQYCHYHSRTGTKMTAPISSFEWYHCHPTTATPHHTANRQPHPLPLFAIFPLFFPIVFQSLPTPPMLPLPRSIWYHSHRTDPLFRLLPLPPNHCHSPSHRQPPTPPIIIFSFFFSFFFYFFKTTTTLPILPLPRSNLYQNDRNHPLFRMTLLPPNHCHSPSRFTLRRDVLSTLAAPAPRAFTISSVQTPAETTDASWYRISMLFDEREDYVCDRLLRCFCGVFDRKMGVF
jgi:hypothetical protein